MKKLLTEIEAKELTKIQALQHSIAHHRRTRNQGIIFCIIDFKDNDIYIKVSVSKMYNAIGETWYDNYCALCLKYRCQECPLDIAGLNCNFYNSPWKQLVNCNTWWQYVKAENNMIKVLKKLLRKAI